MEVYILDKNLNLVMVVDTFTSLIWDKYYNQVGAGELYVPATAEALTYIKQGYYVQRSDDDMICRVRKIELDTSAEDGNYLIFTLESAEGILGQRIVWETASCTGKLEPWLHSLVSKALGTDADADRKIKTPNGTLLVSTGTLKGYTQTGGDQTSYANVAEKLSDICKREGWGYKLALDGNHFKFEIYAGTDRSATVFFSEEFGNLISTKFIDDETDLANVALIAGEGEGANRAKMTAGGGTGADRYELYVDARDLSHSITYGELTSMYSGGTIVTEQEGDPDDPTYLYFYEMATCDVPILSDDHLAVLQSLYPSGTVVTVDSARYYRLTNMYIAQLDSDTPTSDSTAVIIDALYLGTLVDRGQTKIAEKGVVLSFSGDIEPNMNFKYGEDYFLGDIVTIDSGYGITATARIVEVLEVFDSTGHTVTPKYEYINVEE